MYITRNNNLYICLGHLYQFKKYQLPNYHIHFLCITRQDKKIFTHTQTIVLFSTVNSSYKAYTNIYLNDFNSINESKNAGFRKEYRQINELLLLRITYLNDLCLYRSYTDPVEQMDIIYLVRICYNFLPVKNILSR